MKTCTRGMLVDGKVYKWLDLALVYDDHQFGLWDDGTVHIEGSVELVPKESPPPR